MKRMLFAIVAVLYASALQAGTIQTTFVENTPPEAPPGVIVFDMMVEVTDRWIGSELVFTGLEPGVTVHQEQFLGVVHVNGLAPLSYMSYYNMSLDTFFLYPGITQDPTIEVEPLYLPPFPVTDIRNPSTTGPEMNVGWYILPPMPEAGTYKIAQIALDVPVGFNYYFSSEERDAFASFEYIGRVRNYPSSGIVVEHGTYYLHATPVPEPGSAMLLLLGLVGMAPFLRRR